MIFYKIREQEGRTVSVGWGEQFLRGGEECGWALMEGGKWQKKE
jgi:hypothetical protein